MDSKVVLVAAAFAAVGLAGCTTGSDDVSLELSLSGLPTLAVLGKDIPVTLTASGDATSDHVGAHFWSSQVADPTASFEQRAGNCEHPAGPHTLPGQLSITCNFTELGVFYVYAHARVNEDGEDVNFWGPGQMVEVVLGPDSYVLSAANPTFAGGSSGAFDLVIEGPSGSSGHIGAHYWNDSTDDPDADFGAQAGACTHVDGVQSLPGTFGVTCEFPGDGIYYLRGHLRVEVGDRTHDYWTEETMVQVGDPTA
ncbi:MAG: hypothetical protein ACPGQL_02150 [Thermoplasmatota archaeon]